MREITLKFTRGDDSVTVSRASVYRLLSVEGLSEIKAEIITKNYASGDGGFELSRQIKAREITIDIECSEELFFDDFRERILAFFNPNFTGTLTVARSCISPHKKEGENIEDSVRYMERTIGYAVKSCSVIQPNIFDYPHAQLVFLAYDPFFCDSRENIHAFMTKTPLLTFPLTILPEAKATFGIYSAADRITVINDGDIPVGFITCMTVTGGEIANPVIYLSNDERKFIKLIGVFKKGDKIIIDTRRGFENVTLNGENVFIYDKRSSFFSIPIGCAEISVSADSGLTNAEIKLSFARAFTGC